MGKEDILNPTIGTWCSRLIIEVEVRLSMDYPVTKVHFLKL